MKSNRREALRFALCMLPFALVAGLSMAYYSLNMGLTEASLAIIPKAAFVAITTVQTVLYAFLAAFIGYFPANALGLRRSLRFEKRPALMALALGAACGLIFFALDYLVFARTIPQVAEYYASYPLSLVNLVSKVVYGGVIEELLMRWLLLSLVAFGLWKLFARRAAREDIPAWIFAVANVFVAIVFALGHLPATLVLFGELTSLILLRCILLNGSFGLVFGLLYRRYGIQYAMAAHALTHIVCDALLFIVIGY